MRLRKLLVRGEVEIGKDELPAAHVGPLALDRLFHLHDHVAVAPNCGSVWSDLGPNSGKGLVRKPAPHAGTGFNQNRMTRPNQRLGAGGYERDTVFVGLDLFWNADLHRSDMVGVRRTSLAL